MVEGRRAAALVKIVLLGDVNVGKSTMIHSFVYGQASNQKPTTASVMHTRNETINGIDTKLQLWDTAGQEKFQSIGIAFYRQTNSCVLVFDITNKASFDALAKWKKDFLDNAAPRNPD